MTEPKENPDFDLDLDTPHSRNTVPGDPLATTAEAPAVDVAPPPTFDAADTVPIEPPVDAQADTQPEELAEKLDPRELRRRRGMFGAGGGPSE